MARIVRRCAIWVVVCLGLPALGYAQALATVAGVVRDTSGAILPGVTVEASSPVLIERVRAVVSDGTGQYRIVDLRPGMYTITFTLPGFATFRREALEVTGTGTFQVNAEMRVGALEETITVTGAAPMVDVQGTTRQQVMDDQVMANLPTGRNQFNMGVLIPGVTLSTGGLAAQDVGGSRGPETIALAVHGSRTSDQRVTQNGVALSSMVGGGWGSGMVTNPIATQEITIDTAAVSAEMATGGVRINLLPREGGNTFRGTLFGSFASESMQWSNFSQDLETRGLPTPGRIEKNWDFTPGIGGPIVRDRLWFFASGRHQGANNYVAGMFYNRNENDPQSWEYEPDESRPAIIPGTWKAGQLRLTWQVSARNKFGLTLDEQAFCKCPDAVNSTTSPEAGYDRRFPVQRNVQVDWTTPVTSRLLFETSAVFKHDRWGNMHLQENIRVAPGMISVNEQGGPIAGLTFRNRAQFNNSYNKTFHSRAAVSYITGAHAIRVGVNEAFGRDWTETYATSPISYRFRDGIPNQLTLRAMPFTRGVHVDHDFGLFAQDRWTMQRLTLSYGLRYDLFRSSFPEQRLGSTEFTPGRDLVFPAAKNLNYHDVTPKMGAVYDVFGTGRTALKVSLNRYVQGYGTAGVAASPNPIVTLVSTATRNWSDVNGDKVPDCDLLNPVGNGECGPLSNSNFGTTVPGSSFDPEIISGWGTREFNWEFSTGVQHEILARTSLDVSYFRRSYGNFRVTDNRTTNPSDFDPFEVTAPVDPRLPGGGGYVVSGLYNLNPARFGLPADNYVTQAQKFGKQLERYDGIDISLNTRLPNGLRVQGGTSTGRTTEDNCEVVTQLNDPSQLYCRTQTPLQTQIKGLALYTIPRIDVQISGTFQSLPGPQITANVVYTNAQVAPSLGRNLSGGANANVTVNVIEPGTMYGGRLNQVDFRIGKLFRAGAKRATLNLDIYNLFNGATVLSHNNNFATWQRPNTILQARFAKVTAQFDF